VDTFDEWLVESLTKENSRRQARLQEELAVMRPLQVTRLPEYREVPDGYDGFRLAPLPILQLLHDASYDPAE